MPTKKNESVELKLLMEPNKIRSEMKTTRTYIFHTCKHDKTNHHLKKKTYLIELLYGRMNQLCKTM